MANRKSPEAQSTFWSTYPRWIAAMNFKIPCNELRGHGQNHTGELFGEEVSR
uniref:Uncharacterized protein n=1 Tax=Anguilla anguilla TaxID=7936 RepID=A0A0E9T808_ANGAN